MNYFTKDDHLKISGLKHKEIDADLQNIVDKMTALHRTLYDRMTQYRIDLSLNPSAAGVVINRTLTTPITPSTLAVIYTRNKGQAAIVENMMGRDQAGVSESVRLEHHPAIEIRLSAEGFAIEFIVPPTAWYDQQNIIGKLTLQPHRDAFYKLLTRIDKSALIGFWSGAELDGSHIELEKLPPAGIFYQYMDTFAAGRDWLRVCYWYEPEAEAIRADQIQNTLFKHVTDLYQLFTFTSWTSDNNFHRFYKQKRPDIR